MFNGLVWKRCLPGLAVAAALASHGIASAEPVPLPKIDYEAKAKLLNDGSLLVRHSNGKMRIEMQMPQFKDPAIGFIDLNQKRMVLMLPIPGIQDSAIEAEFGDDATFGQVIGQGQRTGEQQTIAGETCTIWKIEAGAEGSASACLTSDNIALRTQVNIDGKSQTVFEVVEVRRQPQNAASLDVPSNVSIIKLPKGLKGIPGFPRL